MKITVFYRGNFRRMSLYEIAKRRERAYIVPTLTADPELLIAIPKPLLDEKTLTALETIGVKELSDAVQYEGKVTTLKLLIRRWHQNPFFVGKELKQLVKSVVKNEKMGRRIFGEFYITRELPKSRFLIAGDVLKNLTIPSPKELKEGSSEIAKFGRLAIERNCPVSMGYLTYHILEGNVDVKDLKPWELKCLKAKFSDYLWFIL